MSNDSFSLQDKISPLLVPSEILNKYKSVVSGSKNFSEVVFSLFDDSDLNSSDEELTSDSVWTMDPDLSKKVRTIDQYFKINTKFKSPKKDPIKSPEKKSKTRSSKELESPCEVNEHTERLSPLLSQDIFNTSFNKASKRKLTKSPEQNESAGKDYVPCKDYSQAVVKGKLTTSLQLSQKFNKSDTSLDKNNSGLNISKCSSNDMLNDSPKNINRLYFNLSNESKTIGARCSNTSINSGLKKARSASTSSSSTDDEDKLVKINNRKTEVSNSNLMLSKRDMSPSYSSESGTEQNVQTNNTNLQKLNNSEISNKELKIKNYSSDSDSHSVEKTVVSKRGGKEGVKNRRRKDRVKSKETVSDSSGTSSSNSDQESDVGPGSAGKSERSVFMSETRENVGTTLKKKEFEESRVENSGRKEWEDTRDQMVKKKKRSSTAEELDLSSSEVSFKSKNLGKLLNLSVDSNRNSRSLIVNPGSKRVAERPQTSSSPSKRVAEPERPQTSCSPSKRSDESDSSDTSLEAPQAAPRSPQPSSDDSLPPHDSPFVPRAVSSFCVGSAPLGKSQSPGEMLARGKAAPRHSLSDSDASDSPEAAPVEAERLPAEPELFENIQEEPWFRSLTYKMRRQTIRPDKRDSFLFLEDLSSEDELYTFQCPKELSVESLEGCSLHLSRETCLTGKSLEGDELQVGVIPLASTASANLLLPSGHSEWLLRCQKVKGSLLMHKESGAPSLEESFSVPRRDESDSEEDVLGTPLPLGLRVRHPLHGTVKGNLNDDYREDKKKRKKLLAASVFQSVENTVEQMKGNLNDAYRKDKKKRKKLESLAASVFQSGQDGNTDEQVKSYLTEDTEERIRKEDKKKKKKKFESSSTSGCQSIEQSNTTERVKEYLTEDDTDVKKTKKKKKKKKELESSALVCQTVESTSSKQDDLMMPDEISEGRVDKKKKKKKRERDCDSEENKVTLKKKKLDNEAYNSEKTARGIFIGGNTISLASEDEGFKKKKKDKGNTISLASEDEEGFKKKKKNKGLSQEVADLLAQMEEKLKKKKKKKNKDKHE